MVQTKLFESRGNILVGSSFSHVWRGSGAEYAAVSHVVVAYVEALVLTLSIISVALTGRDTAIVLLFARNGFAAGWSLCGQESSWCQDGWCLSHHDETKHRSLQDTS